jgi:hypothetical protein
MHSLVEAEARYGTRKQALEAYHQPQQEYSPSQGEPVREVIFLPDATHRSLFTDESDHEAQQDNGDPQRHGGARHLTIREVELAHVKGGADAYHTWES